MWFAKLTLERLTRRYTRSLQLSCILIEARCPYITQAQVPLFPELACLFSASGLSELGKAIRLRLDYASLKLVRVQPLFRNIN